MPVPSFQTCLLVSAIASHTNAQLFFNLETDSFSWDRAQFGTDEPRPPVGPIHKHIEVDSPALDHQHDVEDYHYHEEERLRRSHMHFKEVHHPGEDVHYDSYGDKYHHDWPTSVFQLPRQATDYEFHPHAIDTSYGHHYSNKLPQSPAPSKDAKKELSPV